MPSLCDVNVLLALCHEDHVHHERALVWLAGVEKAGDVIICRISQLGLLRLLNNPAVMLGEPHDVKTAWRDYDALISDERFAFRNEPVTLENTLRSIMPPALVSPKLWQDAYLAAFAIAAGLEFVTFDTAFRQFKSLDLALLSDDD
jgi:toxin-antitoxin system PIN domain toxin